MGNLGTAKHKKLRREPCEALFGALRRALVP